MEALRQLLTTERQRVVEAFASRLRKERLLPSSMPDTTVVDSLPVFLDHLAAVAHPGDIAPLQAVAEEHAVQRLRLGFGIRDVVREHAILLDVILELAVERGVGAKAIADFARVTTEAIAVAVTEYSEERDREAREQTQKHFAFIAHELRNPLTSVRLALERLRRTAPRVSVPTLPDGARPSLAILLGDDAYETIERGVRRLRDLIDNTLVQAKLTVVGDRASTERERLDLRKVCEEVLDDVRADATEHDIALHCDVDAELFVEADRRILYSAISNLVRNAIKFTHPQGRVDLRAHTVGAETLIEVEDECGGLPREKMDKLFDPFVQAGADRSGFGLGLAITRHAAEAHGGHVGVRNVPGKGCVFSLTLPRA